MNPVGAFLKLVRWPNLVFIGLTQVLFYTCVYQPLMGVDQPRKLGWILMASVFIGAAGYIINDYFDLNIDQINKPHKNVFGKFIHRRWAIIWHFILSLLGVLATALAAGMQHWYLILANILCVALLWFYSTSLKKSLLIGNIVISLLTAWTVLILFFLFTEPRNAIGYSNVNTIKFFRVAFLYGGFAFIITLIREAIKDMEDMEGDARYGCRTLPIVAGIHTTKVYTMVWMVVLLAALIILQLYVLQFGWWLAVLYSTLLVIIPLIIAAVRLSKARIVKDFAAMSSLIKWITLSGIVSMIFFRIYLG